MNTRGSVLTQAGLNGARKRSGHGPCSARMPLLEPGGETNRERMDRQPDAVAVGMTSDRCRQHAFQPRLDPAIHSLAFESHTRCQTETERHGSRIRSGMTPGFSTPYFRSPLLRDYHHPHPEEDHGSVSKDGQQAQACVAHPSRRASALLRMRRRIGLTTVGVRQLTVPFRRHPGRSKAEIRGPLVSRACVVLARCRCRSPALCLPSCGALDWIPDQVRDDTGGGGHLPPPSRPSHRFQHHPHPEEDQRSVSKDGRQARNSRPILRDARPRSSG